MMVGPAMESHGYVMPSHLPGDTNVEPRTTNLRMGMVENGGVDEAEEDAAVGGEEEHEEERRGRRRSRQDDLTLPDAGSGGDKTGANGYGDEEGGEGSGGGPPTRKRRRSRKGLDKKFLCPHDGCGKSYSRAEHLYRHQLNHTPKQIYKCDYPDCPRSFVRQDLCARHKERHTARGSQLQRKDAFLHTANNAWQKSHHNAGESQQQDAAGEGAGGQRRASMPHPMMDNGASALISPQSVASTSRILDSMSPEAEIKQRQTLHHHRSSISNPAQTLQAPKRSNSDMSHLVKNENYDNNSFGQLNSAVQSPTNSSRHHSFSQPSGSGMPRNNHGNTINTSVTAPNLHNLSLTSPFSQASPSSAHTNPEAGSFAQRNNFPGTNYPGWSSSSQTVYANNQNVGNFALPPPGYSTQNQTPTQAHAYPVSSQTDNATNSNSNNASGLDQVMDGPAPNPTDPSYGYGDPMTTPHLPSVADGMHRSPFAIPDDFANWLFSEPQANTASPQGGSALGGGFGMVGDMFGAERNMFNTADFSVGDIYGQTVPQQHPMSVTSILDTSLPESLLSEEKRKTLIDLMKSSFKVQNHAPVTKSQDILQGDVDDDEHVLSLRLMQTYISSFWYHFHPQLPILHKPTFVADKTENLLLLAMMAIGASCLDKMHGLATTEKCAELATFIAWHLRSEIFNNADFIPPGKLWVFQALLLLEIYEKMFSTRTLHERAHIHHATTITLMRRSAPLIGRSAADTPPLHSEENISNHNASGGNSASNSNRASSTTNTTSTNETPTMTPDEWWVQWIQGEATRRVAFAAFAIDAIHATMFGHSAVMIAHEMAHQRLPCDEALWSATSSAEVGRIEASLQANGVKPVQFLSGLKRTMNQKPVRTNSFGRTILMAGLLSVSWHMNQKDMQVNSLGAYKTLGGRDKWRGALTMAYDLWKRDFDASVAEAPSDENVFESRTLLHHLAHMAMHVDVVDCQIYAGARRLLGRGISNTDFEKTQKRMREWATSAKARDATFYAARFLYEILLAEPFGGVPVSEDSEYSARDDFLVNRPWVLYFAALTVWSYGYALDGPINTGPVSAMDTPAERRADMYSFLSRLASVVNPADLATLTNRNQCIGMLLSLKGSLAQTRWQLLHEASVLLGKCVDKLRG